MVKYTSVSLYSAITYLSVLPVISPQVFSHYLSLKLPSSVIYPEICLLFPCQIILHTITGNTRVSLSINRIRIIEQQC
ncbi:hypothetical protein AQUCO_00600369v1 [Aquilegia coerulea]|uniref:Uncharacterized protein n=1 Tax=Aquilegia coerulea TaxID=218851 RepID=A0A2G5EPC2_AQUCA|nr:hypothetical protein AQUCO_00600369v1 [Aquilegia coerulea]